MITTRIVSYLFMRATFFCKICGKGCRFRKRHQFLRHEDSAGTAPGDDVQRHKFIKTGQNDDFPTGEVTTLRGDNFPPVR